MSTIEPQNQASIKDDLNEEKNSNSVDVKGSSHDENTDDDDDSEGIGSDYESGGDDSYLFFSDEEEIYEKDKDEKGYTSNDQLSTNEGMGDAHKSSWKQPSPEAIKVSLQAESAPTSYQRRLLSDIYKIMSSDELPFKVEQKNEDRMDQWIVRLIDFDEDSDLYKDMKVLGLACIELQMDFPQEYPFSPPFVRVVSPRFARGTGFVAKGALCMELLTTDGWSPANSVESVIISIQSHLVIGKGRLEAAMAMGDKKRNRLFKAMSKAGDTGDDGECDKKKKTKGDKSNNVADEKKNAKQKEREKKKVGSYSEKEAKRTFKHLLKYHKDGWSDAWIEKG